MHKLREYEKNKSLKLVDDESEFAGELKSFQQLITGSVGLTRHWCQFRVVTSKEFRVQVDAVFDDLNCDEQAIGTQIDQ